MYALAEADDSFDVVHAHQVLQHLTDPVAALREMARVCRPGGVIAVRDVDYGASSPGSRPTPGLDRWLDLYYAVARRNAAEPDAGRRLLSWAHAAGLRDVVATTAPGASPRRRSGSGGATRGPGGRRRRRSPSRRSSYGLATPDELAEIAAAWLRWRDADDGWLGMLHGELLIRV